MKSNLSNSNLQRSLVSKLLNASNYISKTSIYGSGAYVQVSKNIFRVYKIGKIIEFLESTD